MSPLRDPARLLLDDARSSARDHGFARQARQLGGERRVEGSAAGGGAGVFLAVR
jgi:hypothetical protein